MRMSEMTDAYVKLDKVSKIYGTKEVKIVAVDEISFEIAKGEFVVIVGPSGAGKTTVLNILLTPIYFRIYLQAGQILTCLVVLMVIFIVTK